MMNDHDKFLPAIIMMSHTPCHVNIRQQYNGTYYNNNAQHGARYNSTKLTTLPLPNESQRTHLSTINEHNARPILVDSAHFAQPMSHNSTYTTGVCLSFTYVTNRPADRTCIESYIGRQYARTIPNVDIVGSSKCHTRHLAIGGAAGFNCILVTGH